MRFIDTIKALFQHAKQQHQNDLELLTKQLLQHISQQLQMLSDNIEEKIQDVASGRHKPPDSVYEYIIQDRQGEILQTEWHDVDYITQQDISETAGFQVLTEKTHQLGLSLDLIEEPCMEYDDEDRNQYIVRLSGWS